MIESALVFSGVFGGVEACSKALPHALCWRVNRRFPSSDYDAHKLSMFVILLS